MNQLFLYINLRFGCKRKREFNVFIDQKHGNNIAITENLYNTPVSFVSNSHFKKGNVRHCERSEAIQRKRCIFWIASALRASQ
jgi:hypothetical protein